MTGRNPRSGVYEAAVSLAQWLRSVDIPYAIVGGLAASLRGRPRVTEDVDALIVLDEGRWEPFLAAAADHGFRARVADPVSFGRETRVFPLCHVDSGANADLVIAGLPFEVEAVRKATSVCLGDDEVTLARVEDLLVMKLVAGRPRDLADIEGLTDAHEDIDWPYVGKWVEHFAVALDDSMIRDNLRRIREGGRNGK